MLEIANEGAKVLHNRCIEVGQKYKIPIIAKSTFNNRQGTVIQEKIEDTSVKSIVKNDDIIYVKMKYDTYSPDLFNNIIKLLAENEIGANNFVNNSNHNTEICFTIKATVLNKFQNLLETKLKPFDTTYSNISRIAIVGYGIMNDNSILPKIMKIIELNKLEIINLEVNESKIALMFNEKVGNSILEQFHIELINY